MRMTQPINAVWPISCRMVVPATSGAMITAFGRMIAAFNVKGEEFNVGVMFNVGIM